MVDSFPTVLVTYDDLRQMRDCFDSECATLERGLTARRSRPESVFSVYMESHSEADALLDDYRFQQHVLAVSRTIMDYIEGGIRKDASVFLDSGDFFHFLRVALDSDTPTPTILHTIQSHSFVRAVTRHRGVLFQLRPTP